MDPVKKKALFRAKLNALKKDKRIDSPLVRYNELDQPVCRVCNIVLNSESLWDAHQVSRKHREAIENLKANAAGRPQVSNVKPVDPKHEDNAESCNAKLKSATKPPKAESSSVLPPDFFDNPGTKKQKTGSDPVKSTNPDSHKRSGVSVQTMAVEKDLENEKDGVSTDNGMQVKGAGAETIQVKGALPEGFFDNKEDDLRARGIKPVKPDVKDEYKEFEKMIQDDLKDVDDRLEEEEIDAAEMIEEEESVEQKTYRERVELLRKKKMELMAARSGKHSGDSEVAAIQSTNEESSSSDDDSEENLAVDWRAQHL